MSKKIGLIIAILAAVIAAGLVKVYIDQQKALITEQAKVSTRKEIDKAKEQFQKSLVAVLVAKQDMPKGTLVRATMVTPAIMPSEYMNANIITSFDRIENTETVENIAKGEPISITKLTGSSRPDLSTRKPSSLSAATPLGKRAATIAIDPISSVGGMIRGGDYIDVLCVISVPIQTSSGTKTTEEVTIPLFQNILVLASGQEVASSDDSRRKETASAAPIITLALTPQEASLLFFVQDRGGKIKLTLRSPSDVKTAESKPVSWDALFQYISPKDATDKKIESIIKPDVQKREIEIYRGSEKQTVSVYSK